MTRPVSAAEALATLRSAVDALPRSVDSVTAYEAYAALDHVERILDVVVCSDCERRPATEDAHGTPLCAGCYDSRGEQQDERGAL